MDVNAVVAVCGGFVCLENEIKRKRRKIWCKNWLQNRNRFSHMSLLSELAANEPNDFKNYLRMTEDCFEDILGRISPEIEKQSTAMRESITSKERLAATLQFLASGRSYENLKFSCAISPQSLGKIIPETCTAIYNALREEYLNVKTRPHCFFNNNNKKLAALQYCQSKSRKLPAAGEQRTGEHAREHVGCPHRRPSMSVLALGLAGSDEPSAEPNMFAGPKAGRPHTRASMFAANTVTNMLANMLARVWGA
ncbi:hypothetical protein GE061_018675 [Apolygus lucorum]|uniref:Uncharacterized protein n=1 Tax=Apolygus lucorum TaxID=248454 RepID=A0A8S9XEJ9_APOLU|nr:hypothetical protein GE061_018675 [Apolygus lucorum]